MAHSWTAAQAAAIGTRDRTLLISAAAGSGKTATLTERVISSLLDKERPSSLSRLLIVTFTNESAADMRGKIARALDAAIEKDPENRTLLAERLLLPSAKISTIDALCNRLLRQNAEAVGLSPDYRVADTAEAALLSRAVMEELIEASYAGAGAEGLTAEAFCLLADTLTSPGSESELSELLLALYDRLQSAPLGIRFIEAIADTYEREAALPFYSSRYGRLIKESALSGLSSLSSRYRERLAFYPVDETVPALTRRHDFFLGEAATLSTLLERLPDEEEPRRLFDWERLPPLPTLAGKAITADIKMADAPLAALHKEYTAYLKRLKEKYFSYSSAEANALLPALARTLRALYALLFEFEARLTEEKRRLNLCSFADLETLTYRLLVGKDGKKTPTALALSEGFDAVYIDEFQDVNAIQYGIFEALAKEGTLFTVGDIKQSIYSFRNADPRIFSALRAKYPPLKGEEAQTAATLFFSENFRCDRPIVDFVNAVLGTLFRRADGLLRYEEADDLVFSKKGACGTHPVRTLFFERATAKDGENVFPTEGGEESGQEDGTPIEAAEAGFVANEVARLLREGKRNDGEPIRPEDIALLFRSAGAMQAFREAIDGRFKTVIRNTGDFFLNPEVLLALSLLNVIDNPRRDVYLAATLRSPLFGITLGELIAIRETRRNAALYDALRAYCEAHPDFEKGNRFLSRLAAWRREAEGEAVGDLLLRVFRDSGLLYLSGEGADGKHENLLLLYNYARTFESASYRGLYNFIGYINRVIEEKRMLLSSTEEAAVGAVRMMTVHASKGLEFPVCFLCDVGHGFNRTDTRTGLLYERELGLAVRLLCRGGSAKADNPLRNLFAERMSEAVAEEELRVLYVALTRARERLYITGSGKNLAKKLEECKENYPYYGRREILSASSYMSWLMHLPAVTESEGFALVGEGELAPAGSEAAEGSAPSAPLDAKEAERLFEAFVENLSFVYPDETLSHLPEKLSVSRLSPAVLDGTEEGSLPFDGAGASLFPKEDGKAEGEATETRPPFLPTLPAFISGKRADEAALAGTATHLFMQFADFALLEQVGVERELFRLLESEFLSKEEAGRVRLSEIEGFLRSPLFQKIKRAKRVRRELRFHASLPATLFTADPSLRAALCDRTLLVQGVIDCILEEEDGRYTLIDYKTDRLTPYELTHRKAAEEKLIARHRTQLYYYAEALTRMYGKPPSAVSIYSLPLGDEIAVPFEEGHPLP